VSPNSLKQNYPLGTIPESVNFVVAVVPLEALIVMGKEMKNEFDLKILGNFIQFMGPEA